MAIVNRFHRRVVAWVSSHTNASIYPCVTRAPDRGGVGWKEGRRGDACQHGILQLKGAPERCVTRIVANEEVGAAGLCVLASDLDIDGQIV